MSLDQLEEKSPEISTSAEFLKLQLLIDEQLNKHFHYNFEKSSSVPEDWIKDHFEAISGKEGDWVSLLEKILPIVCPHAVYFNFQTTPDEKVPPPYNYLLALWACTALHLNTSVSKLIGVNVRALKAGFHLVKRLCNLSIDAVQNLDDFNVMDLVLDVILAQHIASSMKLLAISALDALIGWPHMMQIFLFGAPENEQDVENDVTATGYSKIIQFAMKSQTARVAVALTRLVRKAHVYECMHRIQDMTANLALVKIPASNLFDEEDDDGFDDEMDDDDEGMVSEQDDQHHHQFDDDRKRTISTASSTVRFLIYEAAQIILLFR